MPTDLSHDRRSSKQQLLLLLPVSLLLTAGMAYKERVPDRPVCYVKMFLYQTDEEDLMLRVGLLLLLPLLLLLLLRSFIHNASKHVYTLLRQKRCILLNSSCSSTTLPVKLCDFSGPRSHHGAVYPT